ncbi:MAG: hypothetical protein KAH86_06705, partial [Methanosarcinales archaeon]|nr:hypothetical protein [Methanosarcinales archaeon]
MKILCGYNVNIDAVVRVGDAGISDYINEYDLADEIHASLKLGVTDIRSMADLFAGLAHCMGSREGAEYLILDEAIFEDIKSRYLPLSTTRMGGNAGIMANVLGNFFDDVHDNMDDATIIVNAPSLSPLQASLFQNVSVPVGDTELMSASNDDIDNSDNSDNSHHPDLIHFVFDFNEGDEIVVGNSIIRAPCDNRFIATFDEFNSRLSIDPFFKRYSILHAREICGFTVSGFHLLMSEYTDGSTYSDHIKEMVGHITSLKSANPDMLVHLEFGHFAAPYILDAVIAETASVVDSVGMNEDEIVMYKGCGHAENVTDAILALAQDTGISRVCVHTKEYVVSAIVKGFIEPDDELDALFFGIKKATSLASRGRPDVPYAPDCITSTKGAMYLQEILSIHGSVESGVSTKEGMYVDAGDW